MQASYLAPKACASAEISVKGSRFAAVLAPATSPGEAKAIVEELRRSHAGASHLCWAWRLGHEGASRSSDAGEPSGTAGGPILRSLESAGVSDALLAVARWFGGTKLGRGGLIRAYGGAARMALEKAQLTRREPMVELTLATDYASWSAVERVVASLGGTARAEFSAEVRGRVTVSAREEQALRDRLADVGIQVDG